MRIVAGSLKGRRLDGPSWDGLRPTSDSLRETLFNVLGPSVAGARVLDVYAGTGAVGIEALSRGAAQVTFIEKDPRAVALIERNVAHVGATASCAVVRDDFMKPRARRGAVETARFDLIFLDPPYDIVSIEDALAAAVARAVAGARIIFEHSRRRVSPTAVPGATRYRVLEAGDSALSFYTAGEEA